MPNLAYTVTQYGNQNPPPSPYYPTASYVVYPDGQIYPPNGYSNGYYNYYPNQNGYYGYNGYSGGNYNYGNYGNYNGCYYGNCGYGYSHGMSGGGNSGGGFMKTSGY
jgi:hypothetical protein